MQKLLEFGAKTNVQGWDGRTALMYAARKGGCLALLLDSGADVNVMDDFRRTALVYAVANGKLDNVDKLIKAGADVNAVTKKGFTNIIRAASKGNIEILKTLIEAGADVNNDREDIVPGPLFFAAGTGHVNCVKKLIQAGADLNIQWTRSVTALGMSTVQESWDCMTTLLKAGAEVDTRFLTGQAKILIKGKSIR